MAWVFKVFLFFFKPLFRILFRLQTSGLEHIKGLTGPLLIVSNHKFFIDSFALGVAMPLSTKLYPIRIMGETKHFNNPWIELIRKLGIIKLVYFIFGVLPITRGIDLRIGLKEPIKILRKKGVVFLHPEGRVIHENGIGQFKRGASFLALETGAKILPVAFKLTNSRIRKNYFVKIGETFKLPNHLSIEEGADYMRDVIVKLYNSISK